MATPSQRTRAEWILEGKGPFTDHLTRAELARFLGVDKTQVKRWQKSGKVRPACQVHEGWHLWCPKHVTEILRKVARLA